jgi:quinol monooxygenase YgiN
MKYSINGYIQAIPEKREELLGYLLEAAKEMNTLETCHVYIVGVNDEESDNVYVYEVWDSEEAHKASLSLPVFQTLIQKARPIIAGLKSYPALRVYGGKGINK